MSTHKYNGVTVPGVYMTDTGHLVYVDFTPEAKVTTGPFTGELFATEDGTPLTRLVCGPLKQNDLV